jgi:Uma2 family endonuclease
VNVDNCTIFVALHAWRNAMSNTLVAPELEIFPNRYRWTVEACDRLMELGMLEGNNEILDGEIISKMGQNPAHANALKRLMRVLSSLFGLDLLWIQSPLTLPAPDNIYNEPEPDITVTRESEDAYADRHPGPEDVRLVVEVSDTTLRTDQIVKSRLYARAGIAEYWILDLNARQLHIYREPANGEYVVVTVHAETDTVTLTALPNASIAITEILPPAQENRP